MTSTSNFGFYLPLVNNATDQDLWGGEINTDLTSIDGVLLTALNWTPSSQTGTITVTAPTSGSTITGSSKFLYLCNAASGAFAGNLPSAASSSGMHIAFKKTDSTGNAITITANGSDKIDGAGTYALGAQYQFLVLACDGTNWDIIGYVPAGTSIATSSSVGTVQPDNTTITVNGSGVISVPTATASTYGLVKTIVTAQGIGSFVFAFRTNQASISVGSTIAGSSLTVCYGAGSSPNGDTITGTWQALQSTTGVGAGLFQRIA